MKIQQLFKLSLVSSVIAVISACGGSGSSDVLPPKQTSVGLAKKSASLTPVGGTKIISYTATDSTKSAQGSTLGNFTYAENEAVNGKPIAVAVVEENILFTKGNFIKTKVGFSGMATTIDVPAASQNMSAATKISIQLASTGASKQLQLRLGTASATASNTGCLPTYLVAVTDELITYNIDLSPANFKLPDFCGGPKPATPEFVGTKPAVTQIQVEDNSNVSDAFIGINVGEIGLVN
jgi:hypothetical protein